MFAGEENNSSPFRSEAPGNNYLRAMRHLGQEIPMKKTKRLEGLQGYLSDDQPGQ
jgi:hypothetical protein